jgi:hypothetical protein
MPMSAERVVELCNLSVNAINEDIALLEAGALEWRAPTKLNVTRQQLFRMRAVVSHLQEIIDGCGCDCIGARATG